LAQKNYFPRLSKQGDEIVRAIGSASADPHSLIYLTLLSAIGAAEPGRSHYTRLLRAGVKIYERRGAVMHSKTASIDGVWSTIGSTNLDWRSFLHNDELNAGILGHDFAKQMDAMFARDMTESDAIDLDRWKYRSLMLRLKEWLARIAEYWL